MCLAVYNYYALIQKTLRDTKVSSSDLEAPSNIYKEEKEKK
jgi:hypothetical protein